MAERFLVIEKMLTAEGYICTTATHPSMTNYFTLRSNNGNILFGLGIFDGKLAIVRYSELDSDGLTAFFSNLADIPCIILAIELLAKGALNANNSNAHVNVA